ncbi:L,D-transpeptidase family protein [Sphingomonas solaris]|nr:L,D-transpeptidase family protein [Sphingomonas solaris]
MLIALAGCSNGATASDTQMNQTAVSGESQLDTTSPSIAADALKASASDAQVKDFYEQTGWRGLWSAAGASALDQAIASRKQNGLDRVEFGSIDASMSPAEKDVARTKAALAYATALANGALDPAKLHDVYTIPKADADVASGLAQALQENRVAAFFAGLAPQDDDYKRLSQAYVKYAGSNTSSGKIAADDTIHPGDRDPRLVEIATELAANGYLPKADVPAADNDQGPQYTAALAEAVKKLQLDYGIKTDGLVGSDTLAVINIGPADKARALAVALERRRWLSRTPPATRIDVNAAAATLEYHRDGKLIDQRRVIVGEPGRETPPLRSPLYRLVANPTWTVPKSISVSQSTIRAKNMHRENGYLVQPSGPDNALGLVKFDMQNDQQIYLHDTSDHALFDRTQRSLSHGCVRVQDALGFAKMIAEQEGIASEWQQARQSSDQTFVDLPKPIPVRLLYHNAFINGDGDVTFRTDPYGWNDAVAKGLGFGGSSGKKAAAKNIDLGP